MTQLHRAPSKTKTTALPRRITERTKLVISARTPPTCVAEIALMMELELTIMDDKKAFRKRLVKVLNATADHWNPKGSC